MAENKAPETANGQTKKRDPHAVQARVLSAMRGQAVRLHLMTSEVVAGQLLANDVYTLALRIDGQDKPVLIFKHAVAWIDWVAEDESVSG